MAAEVPERGGNETRGGLSVFLAACMCRACPPSLSSEKWSYIFLFGDPRTLFLEIIPRNAANGERGLARLGGEGREGGPVDLIGLLRFNFRPAFPSLTTTSRPPRHAAMKLCAVERVMSVRAIGPSNLPYFGIRRINFNDR